MADIFVSYTSSDRDWAFWIAAELNALGHVARIHEWEISGGDDIYAWMESRHDAADHVLCVVSDEYLKAPYSTLERNAALWQAASNRPGFVLLVAVKPSRLPTLTDHMRRCQLYGIAKDEAQARFREFMKSHDTAGPVRFPGGAFSVSNIPVRIPEHFLGRDDSLTAIERALAHRDGRVAITTLHGLRGVGKTTLAAAFAERQSGNYRVTWWIRAQTPKTMRADLIGLGVRLKWVGADEKEEAALAHVMEHLRDEGEGLLLVYDNAINADTIRPYLPRGGKTRILVTSNAHAWRGIAEPVEIGVWTKEIGADYLIARIGRGQDRLEAEALSEALGGLPLAHEQAAAYCERLDISIAGYGKRFAAAPVKFLDDTRHASGEYHDGFTVAKTFAVAIDEAAKLHPAAESLILFCALLAPEPIPLALFSEGRGKLGEPLNTALEGHGLDETVAALRAFALIEREPVNEDQNPEADRVRLHRLVREVAAARCQGEAGNDFRSKLIEAMALALPYDDGSQESAPLAIQLLPHLVELGQDITALTNTAVIALRDLLFAAGQQLNLPFDMAPSEWCFRRALELSEASKAADHTIAALNQLAMLLASWGKHAEARAVYERALGLLETRDVSCDIKVGSNIYSLDNTLTNLAFLLLAQGQTKEALALLERAVAHQADLYGLQDWKTRHSLKELADLYVGAAQKRDAEGDLEGAQYAIERTLEIREHLSGSESLDTANALSRLAFLLHRKGDVASAHSTYARALAIRQKAAPPDDPATAEDIYRLGFLAHGQGDLGGARSLYEQALAIFDKQSNAGQESRAGLLYRLAGLEQSQGEDAAALSHAERAVSECEGTFGFDHDETASALGVLARSAQKSGDLARARSLSERAFAIREKVLGPEHPATIESLANLSHVVAKQGTAEEARSLHARTVVLSEKVNGPDDLSTVLALNNFGCFLRDHGERGQARALFARAIAICNKTLDPGHPLNGIFRRNLRSVSALGALRSIFARLFARGSRGRD